ncbi:MAG: diacylglycerol kinase [Thermodesulfovibrionia bacterium]
MPLRRFIDSVNHAINGILYAAKTQRHMKYHLFSAVGVLILSLVLGVGWSEFAILVILAITVLSAEMLNTAIEDIINILFRDYDKRAKAIKDIGAGAVLITAIGAGIIGYIILFRPLSRFFYTGLEVVKHAEQDVAIISLIVVLILVIITKTFFKRGTPLKGGMPSGHAAVAFSVWVSVVFISESFVVSFLVLLLAILIAQSRVYVGIHRPWEVVLGALLGITITYLLFKIFS